MTILAITVWHQHPDRLFEQLQNYNQAFDGDVMHYVNINADFADSFAYATRKRRVDFSKIENLRFVTPPVRTAWAVILHAYLQAVLQAMQDRVAFDYVYFHTSADLMIRRGAAQHIRQFDAGLGKSWRIPGKLEEGVLSFEREGSDQLEAIKQDPAMPGFMQQNGFRSLYKCRAEGSFFRRALFFEAIAPMLSHWSLADMTRLPVVYPQEEYLLATCLEHYSQRNKITRARHLIATSKNEKQQATIEEMAEALQDPQLFGIKRFDQKADTPERSHALGLVAAG
ncbi:hypothetical protein [Roseomonas sp. 18066]|uniref:hypothetical protein n=1 Tax=Roseomonas sp. 18066 TaxID=2681412 RepID=UPI001358E670|nr:hypothetical protein [Roseomonas sp. 18066]